MGTLCRDPYAHYGESQNTLQDTQEYVVGSRKHLWGFLKHTAETQNRLRKPREHAMVTRNQAIKTLLKHPAACSTWFRDCINLANTPWKSKKGCEEPKSFAEAHKRPKRTLCGDPLTPRGYPFNMLRVPPTRYGYSTDSLRTLQTRCGCSPNTFRAPSQHAAGTIKHTTAILQTRRGQAAGIPLHTAVGTS